MPLPLPLLLLLLVPIRIVDGFSETNIMTKVKPWATLPIDYTAANEFIAEHYKDSPKLYFGDNRIDEDIYNAREGIIEDNKRVPCCLTRHGLDLVQFQDEPTESQVMDWHCMDYIAQEYLPKVESALIQKLGSETVQDVYFWNPTLRTAGSNVSRREEDYLQGRTPRSKYAGMAHIDSDINAYDSITDFLKVVENNIVPGTKPFPLEHVRERVETGKQRFGIINAWRNTADTAIRRSPLAVRIMKYEDPCKAFPVGLPDFENSHWYTFPEMKPNEVLLFAQYDRDATLPSDLWHCALDSIGSEEETIPVRKSLDVRAFVLFRDQVPESRDRLEQRTKSLLDLQESARFCSEQARKFHVK